jgi:2-polyprenyl-6-methoxyphenol hydroxylase-like FAD-dependent oxidoreductase
MAQIIIIGGGMNGLTTAILLARDGHDITVLERDPAEPVDAADAWKVWDRPGVNQFRLPHMMLPRWTAAMARELPEVLDELSLMGGLRINMIEMLPEARRGPLREQDRRFETVTARRPVLETAVATVAARTPGIEIRRGVAVTGFVADASGPVPRVEGVLTDSGRTYRADLVIDCGGRRSALSSWLVAIGARRPVEEIEDSGFVYYGRHFRGTLPEALTGAVNHHDSLSIITLGSDNDTWSVTFVISSRDRALRALRDPSTFDAVLARYPLCAQWRAGEPISDVDAMAGIEDRFRRLTVNASPVATGIAAVGDAWACTNPSLGRGASLGLLHACLLRDVAREWDVTDHAGFARAFHDRTAADLEPLYRGTLWFDRHRLAEIDADVAGVPYRPEDQRWLVSKALFAAGLVDQDLLRAFQSLGSFLVTPDELFAQPGLLDRVMALGASAPQYPLPGPDRAGLLELVNG